MDPTSRLFIQKNTSQEHEQKINEKKPAEINNPIEDARKAATNVVEKQISSEFVKDIKSEITPKFKENFTGKSTISTVRPPPPKNPPPPIPSEVNLGKSPHPDTAALDLLPDDNGDPSLNTPATGTPVIGRMSKQSTSLVNIKTYPADIPIIGSTDYEKIAVSHPNAKSLEKAADKLEFFSNKKDFLLKVSPGTDAYSLKEKYKLTDTEAAAIVAYTDNNYYGPINHQFRSLKLGKVDISDAKSLINAGVKNSELAELIAALVRGMRKLPPVQVDESYFMALGRNVIMEEKEFNLYVEGAEIVTPTFLSTTDSSSSMTSKEVGFWDSKDKALFIYQRVNGNARDIGAFSKFPKEKEILFLPYTKFLVLFTSKPSKTIAGASWSEVKADIENHAEKKSFLGQLVNLFSPNPPTKKPLTKTFIAIQEIPFDATQMPDS